MKAVDDRTWNEWLERLKSNVALDRCDAAEAPPETGEAAMVADALIPLLDDDDSLVRLAAAESLGRYPGTAAAAALREYVLHETDKLARAHGLSSLGLVGDEEDIALLASVVKDPSPGSERIHGLAGLFELVRRIAISRLKAYMTTGSHEIRTSAAAALGTVVKTPQLPEVVAALQEQLSKEESHGIRSYFAEVLESLVSPGESRRNGPVRRGDREAHPTSEDGR